MNRHGIQILDGRGQPDFKNAVVQQESKEKEISHLVRFLYHGKTVYRDRFLWAHNLDKQGSRRIGFGLPGGRVKEGETLIEAVRRKSKEEIPWPVIGEPVFLCTYDRELTSRIEKNHIFLPVLDEENPVSSPEQNSIFAQGKGFGDPFFDYFSKCLPATPGVLLDVDYARFFSIEELAEMMIVYTRGSSPSTCAKKNEGGLYKSHTEMFLYAMEAYRKHLSEEPSVATA
ncbi:MAG: NUDIX hydrolase [Patescibacteria group bacterium]|nr:NUDIX domain-containing protein [Patescibacteria group bacterium]MDE2015216.1 NUDIX hydrolase [Patescibacteria group bacterium]MDE2226643.1 NUDIX hydrolase [Patescibacteria group bacterium]